jgi:hypothetical protein
MPDPKQQIATMTPELLQQLREKAQKSLDAKVQGTNKTMRTLPADRMVDRLKSVLYRSMPIMTACGNNDNRTVGESVMLELMEQLCNAVSDSIKWICLHNGLDYNAPFGDDSLIIKFEDLVLGTPFDSRVEEKGRDDYDDVLLDLEDED